MAESQNLPASLEKSTSPEKKESPFHEWVTEKLLPLAISALSSAVIAAGAAVHPLVGVLAGGAVIGGEVLRMREISTNMKEGLLKFYRKDIAAALGKPVDGVELADVERVADSAVLGEKALKPLRMELDYIKRSEKFFSLATAIRTGVTVAVSAGGAYLPELLSAAGSNIALSTLETIGGVTAVNTFINNGMRSLAQDMFNEIKPPTLIKELKRLQQISTGREVTADHSLWIIAKGNKKLAEKIERNYGAPFAELPYRIKQKAVEELEPEAHAKALTQAINSGELHPSALAFAALGQQELLPPDMLKPPAPVAVESKEPSQTLANFTQRLDQQRSADLAAARVVH